MPDPALPPERVIEAGITLRFRLQPDAWLPIADLATMYHPFNSQVRTHEDEQAIWQSIDERGYIGEPILVNPWNNKLIGGHGRVQILLARGYRGELPVVYEEYPSEAEHRMAMLRANMARGHQDTDKLVAELAMMRAAFESERVERTLGLEPGTLDDLAQEEADRAEAMMAEAARSEEAGEPAVDLDAEGICGTYLPAWAALHDFQVLSVRRWVRERTVAEMAWFEARRAEADPDFAQMIADELSDRVGPLLGHSTLPMWVTTPPCAHPPRGQDAHFAHLLATSIANDLACPFVRAFADWPTVDDRFRTREQGVAELAVDLPGGLCLLIDDYARTGKTMVAALSTLRRARVAVLPMLWIYGEAARGQPNR